VEGSDIHEQSMLPGGAENSEENLEALSRFVGEHEVQIIMNQFCHLSWLTDLCIEVRRRSKARLEAAYQSRLRDNAASQPAAQGGRAIESWWGHDFLRLIYVNFEICI
jgi:hypothetical protein